MRDLRDPQKLGELLLVAKEHGSTARSFYDHICADPYLTPVPDVSKDDSMGKQCVREYRAELEARASEGDKYARSAIDSIDAGLGVQGYDDAG